MTSHLSNDAIAGYLGGTSSSADLLEVDDHLAACETCRRRIGTAERITAGAAALRHDVGRSIEDMEHPTYELIVAYVDGDGDAIEREIVESHLVICPTCAEDVDDLRSVASPAREAATRPGPAAVIPMRARKPFLYAAAGLAAAAALAGVLVWTLLNRAPADTTAGDSPVRSAERVAPAIVLALKDGAGTVTLDASGAIAGIPVLDQSDRDRVAAALRDRRAQIPPAIVSLRGRPGALMGPSAARGTMDLVRPLATAVDSARPVFEWTALPGATSYVVSVFDEALVKVAESEPLTLRQWTPTTALPRGRTYVWQIRARTATDEVTAPAPPAPEARFVVLTDAEAQRVDALRQASATSPLALGVLLADAGLVDEAGRQLEAVVAANPDSRDAAQLLASVKDAGSATNRRR